jgi:hypothetical protein
MNTERSVWNEKNIELVSEYFTYEEIIGTDFCSWDNPPGGYIFVILNRTSKKFHGEANVYDKSRV